MSAHVIPQQQQNNETTTAQSSHFTSLFAHEIDLTRKSNSIQVFAMSYSLKGPLTENNVYVSRFGVS